MKKLFSVSIALILTATLFAQKQKEKTTKSQSTKEEARNVILGKETNPKQEGRDVVLGKENPKTSTKTNKGSDVIWEGTKDSDGGGPKASKNQPAKVRSSFSRDYPGATNVSWSKYRGDWTASFTSGATRSVAVYHANGQRKDTRTVIDRRELPKPILDGIFKKRPGAQLGDIIKIQAPQSIGNIFRVKTVEAGTPRFVFYDTNGREIKYDY